MKKFAFLISSTILLYCSDFSPYLGYIDYNKNTDKKSAIVGGVYISSYSKPYKFELDAEYFQLKYKTSPDYKQSDVTGLLTYYTGTDVSYKLGIHNIFSNTPYTTSYQFQNKLIEQTQYESSYDFVLLLGASKYKYLDYDTNLNLFYSDYQNVKVFQISPSYGKSFGDYYSSLGSFYVKAVMNYIYLNKSDVSPKDSYLNFDFKFQNFKGPWVITLEASIGKSAYKVMKNGFVVYNLGEEYKSIYNINIGRKFSSHGFASVGLGYSSFEETPGEEADSLTFLVNYSYSF